MKSIKPPTEKRPGVSAAWANLPRRRCDDCGKNYKPVRPVRENERGFCSDNCRKSYHKHGGAYRKLKVEVQKMVRSEFAALNKRLREIVREELLAIVNQMWGKDVADIGAWHRAANGTVQPQSPGVPSASPSTPLQTKTHAR